MSTHPVKLVTIICEALAREPLKRLLRSSPNRWRQCLKLQWPNNSTR